MTGRSVALLAVWCAACWFSVGDALRLVAARPGARRSAALPSRALQRVRAGRFWRRRRQRSGDAAAFCSAVAAGLAGGTPPRAALIRAAADQPWLGRSRVAAAVGADIPSALRQDAQTCGSAGLAALAAAWQVAEHTGSGLAAGALRAAELARNDARIRAELEQELAAPRATARILGLLPLIGVAFGYLLGADPVGWLLGAPLGRLCATAGLLLSAVGRVWTGRIAAGAVPGRGGPT